jgi:alginate O-acetyltransferase complex protein AlgI
MDAAAFLDPRRTAPAPTSAEWLFACCKFAAGLAILIAAAKWPPSENAFWLAWAGMVGIVLLLHFGAFHLLSCIWRTAGVDAQPLMRWPVASESLSTFWGRRWNMAFRDLTYRFLFRPLTTRHGPRTALAVGFFVSGLIHDAVISLPAHGGYGGPTLYFTFQALGLLVERSRAGKKLGLGAGPRGWLFTMAVLLAPVSLLFHRPFRASIILPFLHALGTLL